MPKTYLRNIELLVILSGILFYAISIYKYYWAYPLPGDPDYFLIPLETNSHIGIIPPPPFVLGTTVVVGIFSIFTNDIYVAGTACASFFNIATLALGCLWLYYHRGFFATVAFFTIFLSSDQYLATATYLNSAQGEMFFLMLCFVVYYHSGMLDRFKELRPYLPNILHRRFFITGFLGTFAVFCKPLAAGLGLYIVLHLLLGKQPQKWLKAGEVMIGAIAGSITFLFLYSQFVSFKTFLYSFMWFFNPDAPGWTDASGQLWSHGTEGYSHLFLSAGLYSLMGALIFVPLAYFDSKARNCFMCAWAYIGSMYMMLYLFKINASSPNDSISIFAFTALGLSAFLGSLFQKAQTADFRFPKLGSSPFINISLNVSILYFLFLGIAKIVSLLHGFIAPPNGGENFFFIYQNIYKKYLLTMVPTLLITLLAFTLAKHIFVKQTTHTKGLPKFIESKPNPSWEFMTGILLVLILVTGFMEGIGLITMIPIESRREIYTIITSGNPLFSTTFLLLLVIQCLRSRIFAVLFICVIGFVFVPQTTFSSLTQYGRTKKQTDFFYDTFPKVVKQVNVRNINIYVKSWLEKTDPVVISYALKIYRAYFDKLFPKAEPFRPLKVNLELVPGSNIILIGAAKNIKTSWSQPYLLTDDLEAVEKNKIKFSIVQKIKYKKTDYYVIKRVAT